MKYLLITIACCCSLMMMAQKKHNLKKNKAISPTQLAVNRIDSIVNTIISDSSKRWVTMPDTEKKLTGKNAHRQFGPSTTVRAAYQNGQLAILQFMSTSGRPFDNAGYTVYFKNGAALLYVQQLANSSRMGSCGEIMVDFYHYLRDSIPFAGLARSVTSFYSCYGYKLQRPDHRSLFAAIDRQKALLQQYILTHPPAEATPQYPLLHLHSVVLMRNGNEVQDRYGF